MLGIALRASYPKRLKSQGGERMEEKRGRRRKEGKKMTRVLEWRTNTKRGAKCPLFIKGARAGRKGALGRL